MDKEQEEKRALSVSQLQMLEKCGEQYRRRYIEGERRPPGISACVGHGVHGSAAFELRHKIANDMALPTAEEVVDKARDEFQRSYENGVLWTPEERDQGVEAVKGIKIDDTVTMATAYHEKYAPVLVPYKERVEWRWRLRTDMPFDLTGVTDVEAMTDGGTYVRDLKTSAKSPNANSADISEQLTFYAMARQQHDGELPVGVALDYIVNLKRGPKIVSLASRRTAADIEILWARIDRAIEVIEKGAFTPAKVDDWACSEKWCGYAGSCPFFAGRISVAVPKVAA